MADVKPNGPCETTDENKAREPEDDRYRDADTQYVEVRIGGRDEPNNATDEEIEPRTEKCTEVSENIGKAEDGIELRPVPIIKHADSLGAEKHQMKSEDFTPDQDVRTTGSQGAINEFLSPENVQILDTPKTQPFADPSAAHDSGKLQDFNNAPRKRNGNGNSGQEITGPKSISIQDQRQNSSIGNKFLLQWAKDPLSHIMESQRSPGSNETKTPSVKRSLRNFRRKIASYMSVKSLFKKLNLHYKTQNRCMNSDIERDVEQGLCVEDEFKTKKGYLVEVGRAFATYGLPPHMLEEYIRESAKSQSIDCDFFYIPGSIILSLSNQQELTTQLTMTTHPQAIDLSRLNWTFNVYNKVLQGYSKTGDGQTELQKLYIARTALKLPYCRLLAHGFGACSVGRFAFAARAIDLAPIFVLGVNIGIMQLCIAPKSQGFHHLFEIFAALLTSFTARALSSIKNGEGDSIFCFAAITQSSIAMILPGYTALCATLEIQGHQIVSGSSRLIYTVVLMIFLGFGLSMGLAVFDVMNPSTAIPFSCDVGDRMPNSPNGSQFLQQRIFWMPMFAICLAIANQARWRDIPVMTLIALCGNQAHFWISTRILHSLRLANIVAAFVIGLMASLYSRLFDGHAAASMLPALFVQVPSGLAAAGTLKLAILSSARVNGNTSGIDVVNNSTQGVWTSPNSSQSVNEWNQSDSEIMLFRVCIGIIMVAFETSVGLYLSTLVVRDKIGKKHFI